MRITAEEARELTEGSLKRKSIFFKIRLAWRCGLINKWIKHAAEEGDTSICMTDNEDITMVYYPIIAKIYEELGFVVAYDSHLMRLSWDFDNYPDWQKEYFTSMRYCTEMKTK